MERPKANFVDHLTGIQNEIYLNENYHTYLAKNPNANFIMIDFKKFKSINDNFGHHVGDQYLKIFASILESVFHDSIVVRLHGDEFAIVTKYSEEVIEKRFDLCNLKITMEVEQGNIPRIFNFNAGSAKAGLDLEQTKEQADFMMYHIKKQGKTYQRYDAGIYQKKVEEKQYLKEVDQVLLHGNFSYKGRRLFTFDKEESSILQVYTKHKDGSSIFDQGRYNLLKNTSQLLKFDLYNVQNLLENYCFPNQKIILTIDFKSLLFAKELIDSLWLLKDISDLDYSSVILNINLNGISACHYTTLIEKVMELKKIGLQICFDKIDSSIGDVLWENVDISYIKMSCDYWKKAMHSLKSQKILGHKIDMYLDCEMVPIFDFVTNQEEHDFLSALSQNQGFFSGNYYSEEENLQLIRK